MTDLHLTPNQAHALDALYADAEAQTEATPTWAETHRALMARIAKAEPHKAIERGPEFGHGVTRRNLSRSTTKGRR